ncbi:hypothetical protein AUC71_15395 [Methyloceanibacter marginalis]|uniref:Uncharacterized protein n=1 Tax=Methyloceanibacter marginalis TaxID=1774971 RepID=A0A1E3W9M0_9HYPH|nr:hypothetical protein [Methyloceanibacter marginalis]ODS02440.1 hypothetical protein AUC71_15395 [Methyloceanibacter marginalis]
MPGRLRRREYEHGRAPERRRKPVRRLPQDRRGPHYRGPESVTKELTQALIVAGNDRNLTLMPGTEGANYTLRGYLLAAPERQGSKISYIWDVTDAEAPG